MLVMSSAKQYPPTTSRASSSLTRAHLRPMTTPSSTSALIWSLDTCRTRHYCSGGSGVRSQPRRVNYLHGLAGLHIGRGGLEEDDGRCGQRQLLPRGERPVRRRTE